MCVFIHSVSIEGTRFQKKMYAFHGGMGEDSFLNTHRNTHAHTCGSMIECIKRGYSYHHPSRIWGGGGSSDKTR